MPEPVLPLLPLLPLTPPLLVPLLPPVAPLLGASVGLPGDTSDAAVPGARSVPDLAPLLLVLGPVPMDPPPELDPEPPPPPA
jgi:hypothetical protein